MEALAAHSGGKLHAAALCIPGVVYQKTGLVWAPNIPKSDHSRSGRGSPPPGGDARPPVFIESDRNAYVLGEQWLGAAKGAEDVVFLAVGTGIGAGIMIRRAGPPRRRDIAGAVGWFALDPNFKDEYASMGCFEAEASGNSVGRKAARALRAGRPTYERELAGKDVTHHGRDRAAAARQRDRLAQHLIGETVTTSAWASPTSSAC